MALSELHKKICIVLNEHYPHEMTNQAAVEIGEIIKEEIDKKIEVLHEQIENIEYTIERFRDFKQKFQLTND
jgi:nitrogen regulatory protein PII-like uncharacterized protein